MDAIVDVIAVEGYADTTVHKVLKRARISRRTFYEIFKDKEDCFLAAYDEAIDEAVGLVREACVAESTPEGRIESGIRALLEFAEREPKLARLGFVESLAAGTAARDRRAAAMEQLTAMAAAALSERSSSEDEALLRARVLTGGVLELVYDSLTRGRVAGISELSTEIVGSYLAPPEAVHGG